MKIKLNVSLTAALRIGANASTRTILLDIEPAQLTQPERDVLATISESRDDHLDATTPRAVTYGIDLTADQIKAANSTAGCSLNPLVAPTLDALRANIAEMLAEHADAAPQRALAATEKAAKEAAEKLAQERIHSLIIDTMRADITLVDVGGYGVEYFANGLDKDRTWYHPLNMPLPADITAAWQIECKRRRAVKDAQKAAEKQASAATESKILAAMEAALNPTQQAMLARGMLDMRTIRTQILQADAQATAAHIAETLGDSYDVTVTNPSPWSGKMSPNQRQFRLLTKIEDLLALSAGDTYIATLNKATITVHARFKSALDQTVWLAITYPADISQAQ